MSKNIVIIGGGASGLAAAITAAKNGYNVTLLEHKDRVGKKILMTGNGKCNITNLNDFHEKYYSHDIDFVYSLFEKFYSKDTCEFFEALGLYTKEKRDGGIYPVSEQASAVLDVLRLSCDYLGVKTKTNSEIKNINFKNKSLEYTLDGKNFNLSYDKLIIATGGKSASVSGSDGSGYKYAKQLGLKIYKTYPALVALKCEGNFFKSLSGVRAQSKLSLVIDDEPVFQEEGELQLTDYGISGIPVFQFSRMAAVALDEKKSVKVIINFIPYFDYKKVKNLYDDLDRYPFKTVEEYLNGLVNKKISTVVCKINGISPNQKLADISKKSFIKLIDLLLKFEVKVTMTNPIENAQVTAGGIALSELNENLNCKIDENVYFVGEMLDCDGICGGYNLQWAWTTGIIAARHAVSNER